VKLLLQHGANPNQAVESSGNCLSMARWNKAPKEILNLITAAGGVRTVDLVCHDGDIETLGQMLQANSSLAVYEKSLAHPQLTELMLRYQPDILKRIPDPTPWWSLETPKTVEFARWLIERGLDPNRPNWLGITMLHRCAAKGDIEMASVFLDSGANIDATETDSSSTPLACAARTGKGEMAAFLLKRGANRNLPEDEPWAQPLEWAKRRGHADICALLA
jgi:ankyrin repeat protein